MGDIYAICLLRQEGKQQETQHIPEVERTHGESESHQLTFYCNWRTNTGRLDLCAVSFQTLTVLEIEVVYRRLFSISAFQVFHFPGGPEYRNSACLDNGLNVDIVCQQWNPTSKVLPKPEWIKSSLTDLVFSISPESKSNFELPRRLLSTRSTMEQIDWVRHSLCSYLRNLRAFSQWFISMISESF